MMRSPTWMSELFTWTFPVNENHKQPMNQKNEEKCPTRQRVINETQPNCFSVRSSSISIKIK